MAQMLLENPIEYANSIGYNHQDYVDLVAHLHVIRSHITPEMHRLLDTYETNPELRQIIKKSIPKEGSYHRGALVTIVSGAKEGPAHTTLSAASELFYWATAWLDDIADENTFRQNAPSVRASSDNVIAMYASNALYGIVMRAISDTFAKEPQKLAQLMAHFCKNFHVINRGQAIDALMTKKEIKRVSTEKYISLIEDTTGTDIASNIGMGAVVAELDQETTELLYQFGLRLGTLAQIRDDVLDYCDTKHAGVYVIGKLPFRDIETHKKRLPLLLTNDINMRRLPDEIYDRIEEEFVTPRKIEAKQYLVRSKISVEAKETLDTILDYWSDIRLFQKISS